jgi:hypothetical protein
MLLDLEAAPESTRRRGERASERRPSQASAPAFRLERRVDGKLWLLRESLSVAVEVVRCFPWADPERFLSLRDGDGTEHAFVGDLAELSLESRQALQAGLLRSGFVLDVVRVLAIEEDFELRSFSVETLQGPRLFQTALEAWPHKLESGGIVLSDVYGDLYRIAQPHELDERSASLMRAFID